jgi:hypothetical protein
MSTFAVASAGEGDTDSIAVSGGVKLSGLGVVGVEEAMGACKHRVRDVRLASLQYLRETYVC